MQRSFSFHATTTQPRKLKALLENLEQFRKYLDERRFYHQRRCDIFAGSELFAISQKFNSLFEAKETTGAKSQ